MMLPRSTVLHSIILSLMKLKRLMTYVIGKTLQQPVKACRLLLFEQYSTSNKARLLLVITLLAMIYQLSVSFIPSLSFTVLLLIPCSLVASIIHDLCHYSFMEDILLKPMVIDLESIKESLVRLQTGKNGVKSLKITVYKTLKSQRNYANTSTHT